jgi:hypothetical protein
MRRLALFYPAKPRRYAEVLRGICSVLMLVKQHAQHPETFPPKPLQYFVSATFRQISLRELGEPLCDSRDSGDSDGQGLLSDVHA